ncbi:unnamed protein product [Rotaria socialis]|uniref:Translation elongation factor EFTu/EF1A C-terminal domain-containing protein n=1 Tax=Rotaria socialis TaxID=392032 RepID=A0A819BUD4_9BILA|nr:unnamed protein product [Rotaria socialis]CAF3803769.1 unnamed protein product [Rotaria socialis]CAF4444655.1 unnamed protein product [Rotaria socialis]CAF4769039.1 unnamed protein product [Rotaria socialis]
MVIIQMIFLSPFRCMMNCFISIFNLGKTIFSLSIKNFNVVKEIFIKKKNNDTPVEIVQMSNKQPTMNNKQPTVNSNQPAMNKKQISKRRKMFRELIILIDKVIAISEHVPGIPLSCLRSIKDFCESASTGCIKENKELAKVLNALIDINQIIESINLNDAQKQKIQRLLRAVEAYIHGLSNEINQTKLDMIDVKNENQDIKTELINLTSQLIELRTQNDSMNKQLLSSDKRIDLVQTELSAKLNVLQIELGDLSIKASEKVIQNVFANLLTPVIDQIREEFDRKSQEETSAPQIIYDFKASYNRAALEFIKSERPINDKRLKLINKKLIEFAKQSKIKMTELVDLLIYKSDRNFKCHGFIESYINDEFKNPTNVNDFIKYLEDESSVKLILNDQKKHILMMLVNVNVLLRENVVVLRSITRTYLDDPQTSNNNINGPLRIPIAEQYEDKGTIVVGKIESGSCRVGDQCFLMPETKVVEIANIYYEDMKTDTGLCGQNVKVTLKTIEELIISPGFVLCNAQEELCSVGRIFDAQVMITTPKSTISSGYSASLHIHTAIAAVQLKQLITLIDYKTGERIQENPISIRKNQVAIARFELLETGRTICMEPFRIFPELSRFKLRNEGRIVAMGKILEVIA